MDDYERLMTKVQEFVDSLAGMDKVSVRSLVDSWEDIKASEEYMDDEIREVLASARLENPFVVNVRRALKSEG